MPAAVDAAAAAPLEAALKDVVVVRGPDPMAVRDPLPLRLPKEVAGQQPDGEGQDDDEAPTALDDAGAGSGDHRDRLTSARTLVP